MAFKLSRTAFKRLCLLPLLVAIFIFLFYKQIANIYRHVDYKGNITVVQRAFDLFKRQPTDVCHQVELLNIGYPEEQELAELTSYPQTVCNDLGLKIDENDCLVYVIKSKKDEWSFEETMEAMGCRVYSLLLSSTNQIRLAEDIGRNRTGSRIHLRWIKEGETVGQLVEQGDNGTLIDYMMIRMDSGENEWRILSDLMSRNQLDRIKHLSMGVNLCPDRSSFTESHFQYVLDVENQLRERWDMKLFDVANDKGTFVYNPVVKEETYCASQFAWINQRFRMDSQPHQELYASSNDTQQTEMAVPLTLQQSFKFT